MIACYGLAISISFGERTRSCARSGPRRPFVWHIYPQEDDAHRVKLDAFLDCYLAGLPATHAETVRRFWYAWNGVGGMRCDSETGEKFLEILPSLKQYGDDWAKKLALHADLASGLVRFINTLR